MKRQYLQHRGQCQAWCTERIASCMPLRRHQSAGSCSQQREDPWCAYDEPQHWIPWSRSHSQGIAWCCGERQCHHRRRPSWHRRCGHRWWYEQDQHQGRPWKRQVRLQHPQRCRLRQWHQCIPGRFHRAWTFSRAVETRQHLSLALNRLTNELTLLASKRPVQYAAA